MSSINPKGAGSSSTASSASAAGAPKAAATSAVPPVKATDKPAALDRSIKGLESADFEAVAIPDKSGRPTLNAQAYTKGTSINFNAGDAGAASSAGKNLAAHEAAHVVQQKGPAGR